MSIKIEIDRADNGNRFLCRDCRYSNIMSGTGMNEKIVCSRYEQLINITFEVTKCKEYYQNDIDKIFKNAGLRKFANEGTFLLLQRNKEGNLYFCHLSYTELEKYENDYTLPERYKED